MANKKTKELSHSLAVTTPYSDSPSTKRHGDPARYFAPFGRSQ